MDVFTNQNIEQTLLQMYQKVTLFSRLLQGYQIDLQLNTRAFAAKYPAYLLEEQKHPKTVNEFLEKPALHQESAADHPTKNTTEGTHFAHPK